VRATLVVILGDQTFTSFLMLSVGSEGALNTWFMISSETDDNNNSCCDQLSCDVSYSGFEISHLSCCGGDTIETLSRLLTLIPIRMPNDGAR
jgi:hypothetical protein